MYFTISYKTVAIYRPPFMYAFNFLNFFGQKLEDKISLKLET
jgi:hypothetical protein